MTEYSTMLGKCVNQDCTKMLAEMPDESIDLIVTAPPFHTRNITEGKDACTQYLTWLTDILRQAGEKLKEEGSMVVVMPSAFCEGRPVQSLYLYEFILMMCNDLDFKLVQTFYWENTSMRTRYPEWVNKRKIRCKNTVSTILWFSKSDFPKANTKNVLKPYSKKHTTWMKRQTKFPVDVEVRPTGGAVYPKEWAVNNGGAIPGTLLSCSNSDGCSNYIKMCAKLNIPACQNRFPKKIVEFFVKMLTEEGDLVVDIFGGSNTTGEIAEILNRKWLTCELEQSYVAASALRFLTSSAAAKVTYSRLMLGESMKITPQWPKPRQKKPEKQKKERGENRSA